jgi:hypothetical protein
MRSSILLNMYVFHPTSLTKKGIGHLFCHSMELLVLLDDPELSKAILQKTSIRNYDQKYQQFTTSVS